MLLAAVPARAGAGPGTGAADFLKIPVGARATAMGGAFTAVANSADAVYYNPAGLYLLPNAEASFTQNRFVEGVSQQWLAGAYPYKSGMAGLGVNYLSVAPFDAYDNADNRTGSVSADNLAVYCSWADALPFEYKNFKAVSYGATLKLITQSLDTERGSGYGVDLGVLADTPVENLRAGLVIQNALSSKIKFIAKGAKPPLTFKTGVTYALRSALGPVVRGSLDYVAWTDRRGYLAAGLESVFKDVFSLRVGYSAQGDISNGLNFGLGILLSQYTGRNITLDYSFSPTYSFGDIHKLSVTYKFRASRETPASLAAARAAAKEAAAMDLGPSTLAPQSTPSDYYLDIFNTGTMAQRRSAIVELGERGGDDSFKYLIGILKDSNPIIIRDAVMVLSRFNDERVIDPQIELLKSDNGNIRLAAISGLNKYKQPRVLAALAGCLDDAAPEIRSWAAEVLGGWSGFNAAEPLQAALNKEKDEMVRRAITDSLKKLGAGRK